MPYTPNQWVDGDKTRPLSAARLAHMESQYAAAMADVPGVIEEAITQPGTVKDQLENTMAGATRGAFAAARAKPSPRGTLVTRFQPGHGWTMGTGVVEDTTNKLYGTQSIKMTTDGAGGGRAVSITGMTPHDWSNVGVYRFWMMVDDPSRLNRIEVQIGSSTSGWTDYFRNPIADFGLGQRITGQFDAKTAGPMVWMPIEIPRYLMSVATGTPNISAITRVRVFVYDKAGGPVNVWINSFEVAPVTPAWPNGVITLDFDDNYSSVWDLALPLMSARGLRGTAFLINETVGSHSSYMTLDQVRQLQDFHGWEIDTHSQTAAAHTSGFDVMSAEALDTELRTAKAWLLDHGFHGQHLAYPKGQYNTTVVRTAERYFTTSRTVKVGTPNWIGPLRPHELSGVPVTNVSTVADMKAHVDRAKNSGIPRHFIFHRFEAGSSPVNSIAWGTTQFAELLDYILAQGVPVATYGEIYQA